MRETVIDGERFFVFQDVCRELAGKVKWKYSWGVSKANRRVVKLPPEKPILQDVVVVNAAGIEEMRKALELESSHAEARRARRKA